MSQLGGTKVGAGPAQGVGGSERCRGVIGLERLTHGNDVDMGVDQEQRGQLAGEILVRRLPQPVQTVEDLNIQHGPDGIAPTRRAVAVPGKASPSSVVSRAEA